MFDIMPLAAPPRATCREARAHQAAPAIPDVVLFELLSHLSFQDRLKMSQVRPPDHASPYHSYCSSDAQGFSALHDYIGANVRGRAPYLRSIRALWASGSESRYGAYMEMHVLRETIHQALKLAELECSERLVEVVSLREMRSLARLTSFRLAGWPSKLHDLSSLPSSLRSLSFATKGDSSALHHLKTWTKTSPTTGPLSWIVNRLTLQAHACDDIEFVSLSMRNVEYLVHLTVDTAAARDSIFVAFANVMHDMASCAHNLRSLVFVFATAT